ncbi:MAG: alpha/beta hydrolase [Alphaproteobacteria bacterium]|nr:MAG: alpha/beta hydrolase [Alphaproteobacteria bacterium]
MAPEGIIGHTVIGSGPEKVIILHGWWGDYTAYGSMLPFLDRDSFTYAFMDCRGYGKSREMTGHHSIDQIAADALALADHLGWDEFHTIGHSMGGMVVQKIMHKAVGRVKSAVAITPVPASGSSLDEDGRALFHGAATNDDNRIGILNFLTSSRLSKSWYNYVVRRSHETTSIEAFHDYMLAWTETDFVDEVKGNETPLLVLVGEYDQAITAEAMTHTLLEWFPNATFDIIQNSGHFPMLETPARLATLMENYLYKHS